MLKLESSVLGFRRSFGHLYVSSITSALVRLLVGISLDHQFSFITVYFCPLLLMGRYVPQQPQPLVKDHERDNIKGILAQQSGKRREKIGVVVAVV